LTDIIIDSLKLGHKNLLLKNKLKKLNTELLETD